MTVSMKGPANRVNAGLYYLLPLDYSCSHRQNRRGVSILARDADDTGKVRSAEVTYRYSTAVVSIK